MILGTLMIFGILGKLILDKMQIIILGSTGMLGNSFLDEFNKDKKFGEEVFYTLRNKNLKLKEKFKNLKFIEFDAEQDLRILEEFDVIINCIGVIKPNIKEELTSSVKNCIKINSIFPHDLSLLLKNKKTKIIQIATDCVFSGDSNDGYDEKSPHDPIDIYGKSKSLGEVKSENFYNLRCSIIGNELESNKSLFEWFNNNKDKTLNGFVNHHWNGITTKAFSRIVEGIIKNKFQIPNSINIIPKDEVTKFDLLNAFNLKTNKNIEIKPIKASKYCNRVLKTIYPDDNLSIWKNAGYSEPPTINEMIQSDIEV